MEELRAALGGRQAQLEERSKELEEVKGELDELTKLLDEKSKEADDSMDKYCGLMIKVHKLEEANEALSTRLERLADGSGRRRSARRSVSRHQRDKPDDEDAENVSTPQRSPQGSSKRGHRDVCDKDSAQEALHNLTKKIKASTATTPRAGARAQPDEEEEFRPEGLPELVQMGPCCSACHSHAALRAQPTSNAVSTSALPLQASPTSPWGRPAPSS